MDTPLLFYNQVENHLFCSCQADAMAPTVAHRRLLLHKVVKLQIPLHSGIQIPLHYWIHTLLQQPGIEPGTWVCLK